MSFARSLYIDTTHDLLTAIRTLSAEPRRAGAEIVRCVAILAIVGPVIFLAECFYLGNERHEARHKVQGIVIKPLSCNQLVKAGD